jgi:hypothetical protein
MSGWSRREFVLSGSAAALLTRSGLAQSTAGSGDNAELELVVRPEQPGHTMAENFTGLSWESAQLADPTFFSAKNTGLVAQVRSLGPKGQLRLGGSLSDFTAWWDPATTPQRPAMTPEIAAGQSRFEWALTTPSVSKDKYAVITPESIRELRTFCDATGWSVMYGLNLGTGTPERAGLEGACVVRELGPRLDAFAVGNEADAFMGHKRPKTWGFDDYWREYTDFEKAVRARSAGAPFTGPDCAHVPWLDLFAERAGKDPVLLSSHYYHMGYAGDPGINATMLLTTNDRLQQRIDAGKKATAVAGVPYRLTEVGSCAHGGQPGASDAFASALWVVWVMLEAAQGGIVGVNPHGGGLAGVYSPIVGDQQTGFTARPITYGMRLANLFAGATFVSSDFNGDSVNAYAYAARKDGRLLLAVVNKGGKTVRCRLKGARPRFERATALTGTAIDATTGTKLREVKRPSGDVVIVPAYSALVTESRL